MGGNRMKIALTGAGGFIGSVVLGYLNKQGIDDILIFDDLPHADQFKNLVNKKFKALFGSSDWGSPVDCVIHIGANSSTLGENWSDYYKSNVLSTREWHNWCKMKNIPFIFISSAGVYGHGNGPVSRYAFSKAVSEGEIDQGVVLRLFNVYGPNEYHKGRMASTLFHWHNQLQDTGKLKLFNDSVNYYRDFIYVEDVARVIWHFVQNYQPGTYDVGTGDAHNFETVANHMLANLKGKKKYVPMPEDLLKQYQTWTKADTANLTLAGVDISKFRTLKDGVAEYVDYLKTHRYY
jgi:ADP-L-glycero-D-manno-heptose 6-epimerase